jgi:hypothetical protein
MKTTEPTTTRRGILGHALLVAAGAFGAGSAAASASGPGLPVTTRLTVRHVGVRNAPGHRYALLLDERGRTAGHLAGVGMPLRRPFSLPSEPSTIELHTLTLDGGTLTAQGALTGTTGTFHLVGGTGRFSGVSGSYDLRLADPGAALTLTTRLEEAR